MDSKKFLQLVEEKKKKALEKKQARLEWEERLEGAAMAPRRGDKRTHRKHKRKASSDSSIDAGTNRRNVRRHKKRRSSSSSSDYESFHREGRVEKRSHGKHKRRGSSSDSSASDSDAGGHRSRKRYRRKHKSSSHDLSDRNSDETERRNRSRHRRWGSESDASDSHDEEKRSRRKHKQRETDSDDSIHSGGKRKHHHGHKHRKHTKKSRVGDHKGGASSQEGDRVEADRDLLYKERDCKDSKEPWNLDRYRSEDQMETCRDDHKLQSQDEVHEAKQKDEGDLQNHHYMHHDTNGKQLSAVNVGFEKLA